MRLDELRLRVQRAVGQSSSDPVDTAMIDAWANEAVLQFLRETKVNVVTAAMTTTADVQDYTMDGDILSFHNIWYTPASGGQRALLEPISARDMQSLRLAEASVDSIPRYYSLQGAHLLLLYPTPSSDSDTVHILYTPRPGLLSADSHEPSDETRGNIPEEYHSIIEAYVKWKAASTEEHRPSEFGLTFQAEWERGISKARADLNRKAGVFRAVKVPGRRSRFPMTPGTDLR